MRSVERRPGSGTGRTGVRACVLPLEAERRLLASLTLLSALVAGPVMARSACAQTPEAVDSAAFAGANAALRAGALEDAATAYRRIVGSHPESGRAWYLLGQSLYGLGRFTEAADAWARAARIGFQRPVAHYNAASAHARAGATDSAFAELRAAVEAGFARTALLHNDRDMNPLRDDPRFGEIVDGTDRNAHPCRYDAERRALDFWLGRWRVVSESGPRLGTANVERVEDGCALRRRWTPASGAGGASLVYHDPASSSWRALWIGEGGDVARYGGDLREGRLVMSGEEAGRGSEGREVRFELARLPSGRLGYTEARRDAGTGEWSTVFDGIYIREGWEPGDSAAPGGGPSLRYVVFHGGQPAAEWQEESLARYRSDHPDLATAFRAYNIYGSPVPRDLDDVVREQPPPDVLGAPIAGDLRRHARAGLIADISDLWEDKGWADSFPARIVEMASLDGGRYFIPGSVQPNPVYYRTDVLERVGIAPPRSWEELLSACRALADSGLIPFTISLRWHPPVARWFTILNLRLNGPTFHEKLMGGRVKWDGPEVRRVFGHWRELFDAGCFEDDASSNTFATATRQLANGEAAMWLIGEWIYEFLDEESGARLDFFAFPTLDDRLPRGEIVHVYGWMMPSGAPNEQEARSFLSWVGGSEVQRSILREQDRLVTHLGVSLVDAPSRHRKGLTFVAEADVLVPLFEVSTERDMAQKALDAFRSFWLDRSDENLGRILTELEEQRKRSFEPASM